jgi:nitrite reductase (NADH) small subunit
VPVGRFGIRMFNFSGTYHALTNYCPHEGGPPCVGSRREMTEPSNENVGGVGWIRAGEIIRCSWHQWEFDIATGETLSTPVPSIRTYPVEVIDGDCRATRVRPVR